jgi:hypothetical protein
VRRYDGPGQGVDKPHAIDVSPDNAAVFVTGSSYASNSGYDYATIAYRASTGTVLWTKRYDNNGTDDSAAALTVGPHGGRLFVTGSSHGSGGGDDYFTIAYDASTGDTSWTRRYDGTRHATDAATAIGVSPDGSEVFVTGYSIGPGSHQDYATVAYSASTGNRLWSKRYDGPGNEYDSAAALAVSPDGSVVTVTGTSVGSDGASDFATIAYDASSGARLWVTRYSAAATGNDFAAGLGFTPDGSEVIVTGFTAGSKGGISTLAYDTTTGTQLWAASHDGRLAAALEVSPDGSNVLVAGTTRHGAYLTLAYDASTGATVWEKRYAGPGNGNQAAAIGLSPDGSQVFVSGWSTGSADVDNDFATVAYNGSTGAHLWTKRYDGGSYDGATALSVSSDGLGVFVTGYSTSGASGPYGGGYYDYATVAYSAG